MAEKHTRVSLKGMTEDERKERKRVLQKEYMAKRRETDPEFLDKQREYARNRGLVRTKTDEDYVSRKNEYNKVYYQKRKEALLGMKAKIELLEKTSVEMIEYVNSVKITSK
jgi:hypothetical protein